MRTNPNVTKSINREMRLRIEGTLEMEPNFLVLQKRELGAGGADDISCSWSRHTAYWSELPKIVMAVIKEVGKHKLIV